MSKVSVDAGAYRMALNMLARAAERHGEPTLAEAAEELRKTAEVIDRPAPAVQVPEEMVLVSSDTAEEAADWLREAAATLKARHSPIEGEWGKYSIDKQARREHDAMLRVAALLAAAPAPATVATKDGAQAVGDLLAIIHRDGGHYQAEHGIEKAARDAIAKYNELRATLAYMGSPFEPMAQGGGVDVEKVMALVEEFGSRCSLERAAESDRDMRLCGRTSAALFNEIRALLSASPAGVGVVPEYWLVTRDDGAEWEERNVMQALNLHRAPHVFTVKPVGRVELPPELRAAAPAIAKQGEGE